MCGAHGEVSLIFISLGFNKCSQSAPGMNYQYKLGVPKEIRWGKRGGNKGEERREEKKKGKERRKGSRRRTRGFKGEF